MTVTVFKSGEELKEAAEQTISKGVPENPGALPEKSVNSGYPGANFRVKYFAREPLPVRPKNRRRGYMSVLAAQIALSLLLFAAALALKGYSGVCAVIEDLV